MRLEALTRLLGKKSNKPHDPEQTAAALAEVDAELEIARRNLAEAEAAYDDGVVQAVAANDDATRAKLREAVEDGLRRLELLQVTRAAVERRHTAAQEAQEARQLAGRWESAREACDARREALVRLAHVAAGTHVRRRGYGKETGGRAMAGRARRPQERRPAR